MSENVPPRTVVGIASTIRPDASGASTTGQLNADIVTSAHHMHMGIELNFTLDPTGRELIISPPEKHTFPTSTHVDPSLQSPALLLFATRPSGEHWLLAPDQGNEQLVILACWAGTAISEPSGNCRMVQSTPLSAPSAQEYAMTQLEPPSKKKSTEPKRTWRRRMRNTTVKRKTPLFLSVKNKISTPS
eukprot:763990-Hanusia_phi.AAC.3